MQSTLRQCEILVMPRALIQPEGKWLDCVSDEAKSRASTFQNPGRICDFLWSRVLLNQLIEMSGLSAFLSERPPLSPLVCGSTALFTSISHTSTYVAAALSPIPVGIDIEVMNPRRNLRAISDKVFGAGVFDHCDEEIQVETFYRHWGIHEAAVKMPAKLMVENNRVFAVSECGHEAHVQCEQLPNKTLLTVMTSEALKYRITFVDLEQFAH